MEKYDKDLTEITTMLDKWTTFLKKAEEYNRERIPKQLAEVETIKRAVEVLETMSLSDDEREVYEARLKWLRDEEMALKSAEKKGIEKGIEKGEKKKSIEIAKNLLKNKVDIQIIINSTGLTEEDIKELD